ncbi:MULTISPECIES: hypothetical protein [Romboutsia]|uniref:Uncharacterized protein n=1 Tax=Romboutsia hominis TaxID=1507512 RepID=A0A2P2BNR4_9FIRM|nr:MULTISPECIES: hypothetical protein [Romboutsia]MCH1959347.1 hypothetical protein [Romboutsia hominis]MCH1970245.1 hypothetical protein [Romboutsia hominis]MDB8790240.1 hypothetical protein [Romboutsia sp. 1001216sp1]MDB8792114.1 hypothetical protein [Romboutsia sp. 1001216sp1]MDB8797081.1 hypothetical protein [Romboutsia sp. 1001216sp1]
MKYISLLISSIGVFLVILGNFYYNSVTLDMQKIKDYVAETNIILEDIIDKEYYVLENKQDYIKRLNSLKEGLNNTDTTFLIDNYKNYKVKSIDSLVKSLKETEGKKIYLGEVEKYNKLCDREIDRLIINKNLV